VKPHKEIYLSIDIEADGAIPGGSSMLSIGAAAFDLAAADPRAPIATFTATIEPLPGATPSPSTMAWWAQPSNADAWAAATKDPRPAAEVMPEFVAWVRALPGRAVIVGYPVTYDFMFVYWYTMAFGGLKDGERAPFGFQGLDIKTLAWTRLGGRYNEAHKKSWPRRWSQGAPPHTHEALDDAIGQGVCFVNMLVDTPSPHAR